jgi:RNA polymerase subunit RPABC4/transcription elongation factor Spt4
VSAESLNRLGARDVRDGTVQLSRGRGCPQCRSTGYHGRMGIFETLDISDGVRGLITQNVSDAAIRRTAIDQGMRTMGEDGIRKVLEGHTTLDEVSRVIYLADQACKTCPSCASVLPQEFEYCPSCGEFVGEHCSACRRRLDPGWTWCPYCGEAAGPSGAHHDARAHGGEEEAGAAGRDRRRRPRPTRPDPDVLKKAA